MPEEFILIPGRTSRQGTSLNEGKYTETYLEEINTLQIAPEDMERLGLADGDQIRMWNEVGRGALQDGEGGRTAAGNAVYQLRRQIQPADGWGNSRDRDAGQ